MYELEYTVERPIVWRTRIGGGFYINSLKSLGVIYKEACSFM
jgi:hypothetical protein